MRKKQKKSPRFVTVCGAILVAALCMRSFGNLASQTMKSSSSSKGGPRIHCDKHGTSASSCRDPVGVVGEWVFQSNRAFAAPVCCGWDGGAFKQNPTQCGTQGIEDKTRYSGRSDFYQLIGGRSCTCANKNFTDHYEWHSPTLPRRFYPFETCRLLGSRVVLMIGDSTMQQTASTLMNALFPAHCQTQITFILSDTLTGENYGGEDEVRGMPWYQAVEAVKPDIVLVSAGAHVHGDDDGAYMRLVNQVLAGMKEMKQQRFPKITFAWNTQIPGGCTNEIVHTTSPALAAKEFDFSKYRSYNHGQFYQRDLYLLSRLQELGMPYLDMRMLYSRSDAHITSSDRRVLVGGKNFQDCLHMCSPGPLDVMARLFQTFLVEIGE